MSVKVLGENQPKARKEHTCFGCGGKIARGERHSAQHNKVDGDVGTCRMHLRCRELFAKALDAGLLNDDNLLGEGELRDLYPEEFKTRRKNGDRGEKTTQLIAALVRAMEVPLSMNMLPPSVRGAFTELWDDLGCHGYPSADEVFELLKARLR